MGSLARDGPGFLIGGESMEMRVGPVYGVTLIDSLPLDGGMKQAMPNEDDLRRVLKVSVRTVAGYEVLLEHFRRQESEIEKLLKIKEAAKHLRTQSRRPSMGCLWGRKKMVELFLALSRYEAVETEGVVLR